MYVPLPEDEVQVHKSRTKITQLKEEKKKEKEGDRERGSFFHTLSQRQVNNKRHKRVAEQMQERTKFKKLDLSLSHASVPHTHTYTEKEKQKHKHATKEKY